MYGMAREMSTLMFSICGKQLRRSLSSGGRSISLSMISVSRGNHWLTPQGGVIQISKKWLSLSSCVGGRNQVINDEIRRTSDPEEDTSKAHVVYEGGLSGQLKRVKIFSMITSVMGMSMQPVIFNSPDTHMAAIIAMLGMIGFFTYVTPFLIHQLAKKYVTEIIYNPENDTYTVVRYTFFLRRNELTFTRDQVVVPDAPGPFTTLLIDTKDGKKTALFFALESFKYPEHYGLLMGYDKPLDLHISAEDIEAVLKKQKEEKLRRKEK